MAKDSVLTLRVETDLLDQLRELARRADVGVSDLVRAAAKRLIEPDDDPLREPRGYRCAHVELTGAGLTSASHDGCKMRPIF